MNSESIFDAWSFMLSEIADSYTDISDEELKEEEALYGVDLDAMDAEVQQVFDNALVEFQAHAKK